MESNYMDSSNLGLLIKILDDEISKRSLLNHQFYTLLKEGKLALTN